MVMFPFRSMAGTISQTTEMLVEDTARADTFPGGEEGTVQDKNNH